ncbi:MAG: class I tRNA ligase family protein, partial [Acidobacteria bacterium]|nr:class I tRNA ligase family protein [Acidobacteriota bacterium]
TAPGHGQEDYAIGMQYGIPVYCPVDAQGRFFQAEGAAGELPAELLGQTVWDGNQTVINILREKGALLGVKTIDHSYPHCWRCHNPTIFRATEQWFIGMERNELRQKALEAIKNVKWKPEWGEERISNMIAMRPDWCISRQRVWGVPITVFYCESCSETLTDKKLLDGVVRQFRQHTADVWYEKTAAELIGSNVRCAKCGGGEFRKETDILDVWFDSGSSHLAVLTDGNQLRWPADLYVEGGDQYRGWFHSSLLIGVGLRGESPYRNCATHGWTLDADGRAMSKSLGNIIEPEKIVKQYGAEILRLWVSSVEFTEDVRISETMLQRLSEAYRKLRNTFRYALGNLDGFDPATDSVPVEEMQEIDQWILVRGEETVRKCLEWYGDLSFHRVYKELYYFATTDLSAIYFDVLKDRLYTSPAKSEERRSAQTALYKLTYALVRLMAPLLTFTTEEVWGYIRKPAGAPDSVHLAEFPEPGELTGNLSGECRYRLQNWERLIPIREQVLKALETARQEKIIGAPLEAQVTLRAGDELYPLLSEYEDELPGLFIVSQVTVLDHADATLEVHVAKAEGAKCERCWKYTTDVGTNPDLPGACAECEDTVSALVQD